MRISIMYILFNCVFKLVNFVHVITRQPWYQTACGVNILASVDLLTLI